MLNLRLATRLSIFALTGVCVIYFKQPLYLWLLLLCWFTRHKESRKSVNEHMLDIHFKLDQLAERIAELKPPDNPDAKP